MAEHLEDPVMPMIRASFTKSGLSLQELGVKMGYSNETARKSAWQFIRQTGDPRLSMLRRFARAVGENVLELMFEPNELKKKAGSG